MNIFFPSLFGPGSAKVRITAGDTKTEEYKKMNPLCKVEYLIYTSYVRYARWNTSFIPNM